MPLHISQSRTPAQHSASDALLPLFNMFIWVRERVAFCMRHARQLPAGGLAAHHRMHADCILQDSLSGACAAGREQRRAPKA